MVYHMFIFAYKTSKLVHRDSIIIQPSTSELTEVVSQPRSCIPMWDKETGIFTETLLEHVHVTEIQNNIHLRTHASQAV